MGDLRSLGEVDPKMFRVAGRSDLQENMCTRRAHGKHVARPIREASICGLPTVEEIGRPPGLRVDRACEQAASARFVSHLLRYERCFYAKANRKLATWQAILGAALAKRHRRLVRFAILIPFPLQSGSEPTGR